MTTNKEFALDRLPRVIDASMTGIIPADDIYALIGANQVADRTWNLVNAVEQTMLGLGWKLERRRPPYGSRSTQVFCKGDENHFFKWSVTGQAFVDVDDPNVNVEA